MLVDDVEVDEWELVDEDVLVDDVEVDEWELVDEDVLVDDVEVDEWELVDEDVLVDDVEVDLTRVSCCFGSRLSPNRGFTYDVDVFDVDVVDTWELELVLCDM